MAEFARHSKETKSGGNSILLLLVYKICTIAVIAGSLSTAGCRFGFEEGPPSYFGYSYCLEVN